MFTGIIEGLGTVTHLQPSGLGRQMTIEADFDLQATKIGDSIAVSGACLTVVALDVRRFKVDVSPETLKLTTFGKANAGERVNLERALRLGDRIDGHMVSGHIDGLGLIREKKRVGNAVVVTIGTSSNLARYLIAKGSVAVDGISLTVNTCEQDYFTVSIIPHTAKLTTMGIKKAHTPVNIETDLIGKYVHRFVSRIDNQGTHAKTVRQGVDMEFLAKSGFL